MNRCLLLSAAVVFAASLVLGGCGDQKVEPDHPTAAELSGMNREQMMLAGQNKIADGQTRRSNAMLMADDAEYDGMTKQQLIEQGDRISDRGRAIVNRAEQMPPTDMMK